MPKMTVKGLEDFSSQLRQLGTRSEGVMKCAVFDGAAVLIEAVKEEIRAMPEEEGYLPPGAKRHVLTKREKQELLDHVGIAHMKTQDGKVSTTISFEGYTEHTTRAFPGGVPIPLIARSLEKGTSVRHQYDFLGKALNKARARVQQAMINAANERMNNITK